MRKLTTVLRFITDFALLMGVFLGALGTLVGLLRAGATWVVRGTPSTDLLWYSALLGAVSFLIAFATNEDFRDEMLGRH